MNADAIINVRFKRAAEGGRKGPIVGDFYACPLFVDGEGFDCRIILDNQKIELGEWYILPVRFLNRDLAMPKLAPGKAITLREGKDVANGQVLHLDTGERAA